jgi:hypothetical protein
MCRYRHLFWETGMIGQVLYLEAEAQGVSATGIGSFFDDPVHELMGLPDDAFQSHVRPVESHLEELATQGEGGESPLQRWRSSTQ